MRQFLSHSKFELIGYSVSLRAQNAKVQLLDKEGLKDKFKWINTDDLELGSFGNMTFIQ